MVIGNISLHWQLFAHTPEITLSVMVYNMAHDFFVRYIKKFSDGLQHNSEDCNLVVFYHISLNKHVLFMTGNGTQIRHVFEKRKMIVGLLEGILTMLKGEVAMVYHYPSF